MIIHWSSTPLRCTSDHHFTSRIQCQLICPRLDAFSSLTHLIATIPVILTTKTRWEKSREKLWYTITRLDQDDAFESVVPPGSEDTLLVVVRRVSLSVTFPRCFHDLIFLLESTCEATSLFEKKWHVWIESIVHGWEFLITNIFRILDWLNNFCINIVERAGAERGLALSCWSIYQFEITDICRIVGTHARLKQMTFWCVPSMDLEIPRSPFMAWRVCQIL